MIIDLASRLFFINYCRNFIKVFYCFFYNHFVDEKNG